MTAERNRKNLSQIPLGPQCEVRRPFLGMLVVSAVPLVMLFALIVSVVENPGISSLIIAVFCFYIVGSFWFSYPSYVRFESDSLVIGRTLSPTVIPWSEVAKIDFEHSWFGGRGTSRALYVRCRNGKRHGLPTLVTSAEANDAWKRAITAGAALNPMPSGMFPTPPTPSSMRPTGQLFSSTADSMKPLQQFSFDEAGIRSAMTYLEQTGEEICVWIECGPSVMQLGIVKNPVPGFSVSSDNQPGGGTAFLVGHPEATGWSDGRYSVEPATAYQIAAEFLTTGATNSAYLWDSR